MAVKKIVFVGALALSILGFSQETPVQTESFTIKVTGQKTWSVLFGFGDATLLSLEGLTPGQLTLRQSLWAEIQGTALDFLTLKASFNDQLGAGFQEFLVVVDREPWYLELGRFVVGGEGEYLGVYNKRVLGARVSLERGEVRVGGLLARQEGISESLTFRGDLGHRELLFSYEDPERPWLSAPYLSSVEGLWFFILDLPFVEGFSQPTLQFLLGPDFSQFLEDWGLGFLGETFAANPTMDLPSGAFQVLRDEGEVLLLRQEPKVLLRQRVLDLLDLYNTAQGLSGAAAKSYPFLEDSALELSFLQALAEFCELVVDEESYPLSQAQRRRYLALGEANIREESLSAEIRLPGEDDFRPLPDPALSDFQIQVFPKEGVLCLDFPEEFFREGAAISVAFDYTREGTTFFLGLSVIPGSDRVYRNGELLTRNTDYSIDYETGVLILFSELGPEDELRVDFERERGGLGVATEYERYFLGTSLGIGPLSIGIWQAADLGTPGPTTRTMPNTHSLATLSWQGDISGWDWGLRLGFSENVFPPDANARIPAPNRINAITSGRAADGNYLAFLHQNGITVYQNGAFTSYGSAQGLSGQAALCALPLPYLLAIGTDSGLTLVDLSQPAAFDRIRSWTRLYPDDWNEGRGDLPKFQGQEVLALAQDGERIYLATEAELIVARIADLRSPEKWEMVKLPQGRPAALLWAGALYLGTDAGLYILSEGGWTEVLSGSVHALLRRGSDLFVAGELGVRIIRDGLGSGWLHYGEPVASLALWEDAVWYVSSSGIHREGELVTPGEFTAIGAGPDALWAGTRADEDFNLDLWRVVPEAERFPSAVTKIDGRDLGSFRDPPAGERTRSGPAAALSLSRSQAGWDWRIHLSSQFPGYEEIGRGGRTDAHGLGFTASYGGSPWSLNLRGQANLMDLTTQPRLGVSGGLSGEWVGPVRLTFSLSPAWTGEGEAGSQFSTGFGLGLSGKGPLDYGLSLSGKFSLPFYLYGDLGASLGLAPWSGFSLSLGWTRPVRTQGSLGTETFTLTGKLSGGEGIFYRASGTERWTHSLSGGEWSFARSLEGELRFPSFTLSLGKLGPRVSLKFNQDPAETRVRGSFLANLEGAPGRVQLTLTGEQGWRPATERTDRTLSLSLSWGYSGWPGVQPSLSYTRSTKILLHPRYPSQTSETQAIRAELLWDLGGGNRDRLSLSWSLDEGLKLGNKLVYKGPWGTSEAEVAVTLKEGKITGTGGVQAGLALGSGWGVSLEAKALFGAFPLRLAGFLGATLAVDF